MQNELPAAFLARMRTQLGDAFDAYCSAMTRVPGRALRVNTLKLSVESFRKLVDFPIEPIHMEPELEESSVISEDFSIIGAINHTIPREKVEKSSEALSDPTGNGCKPTVNIEKSDGNRDDPSKNAAIGSRDGTKIEESDRNAEYHTIMRMNDAGNIEQYSENADNITISQDANCDDSFFFADDVAIGRHPLHIAGLCYVQEPSAQQPVRLLNLRAGMTVLDLCAAPGGKTGQIAARLAGTGCIIANEPVPPRAEAMMGNLERLGVTNAIVTNLYPDALCGKLAGVCDAVLVDAPCSGEGMFRREPSAVSDWSEAHVRACAERQRGILANADLALKPGGTLVYSTCTFSREENEETVTAFLRVHPEYALLAMRRIYPHASAGEGQFMAKLFKRGEGEAAAVAVRNATRGQARRGGQRRDLAKIPAWDAFCEAYLCARMDCRALLLPDGRVLLPPPAYFDLPESLRVLRAGLLAGEVQKGRFIPAHALCMALPREAFRQTVPLAGRALSAFLAGETVPCEQQLSGWCAVTALGYPLGWGKAVGGTLKNHIPRGLRLK